MCLQYYVEKSSDKNKTTPKCGVGKFENFEFVVIYKTRHELVLLMKLHTIWTTEFVLLGRKSVCIVYRYTDNTNDRSMF